MTEPSSRYTVPVMEHKRLSEAIADFHQFRARRHFAASTRQHDQVLLARFLHDVGDRNLRYLTADHVTSWFYGEGGVMSSHVRRGNGTVPLAGITPATHNLYRSGLAVFFRFCTTRGWIKKDLLEEVMPLPVPRKARQQPAPNVLLAMVEAAPNPRDRIYLAVSVNTALRTAEICRIKVGDVALANGTIHVLITKTGEVDEQPITGDLDREIRTWLVHYEAEIGRPLHDEDYLIPSMKNRGLAYWESDSAGKKVMKHHRGDYVPDVPITKNSERIVQGVMSSLGMATYYEGTHTIRRAVARAFFDSMSTDTGYDAALRTTSALLHHRNTSTTERYLGLTSEKVRRDGMLIGKPFLTAMVAGDNVVPLRAVSLAD